MPYKPMLAHDAQKHIKKVQLPCFVQPKLDGVRLCWDGEVALSRTGKPLLGVPKLVKLLEQNFKGLELDGELYVHGKSFQSFLGDIRRDNSKDGREENEAVEYHVYDAPHAVETFEERYERMVRMGIECHPRIKMVETEFVATDWPILDEKTTLLQRLDRYTTQGYEGTMYRTPGGLYGYGKRSADLLKIKTFQDAEFECVGVTEKLEYEKLTVPAGTPGAKPRSDNGKNAGEWYKDVNPKPCGTTGALVLRKPVEGIVDGPDYIEFQSGSGLDDETRAKFWKNPPIGKMITVKFFELTDDGIPRFPIFKAVRDYE